MARPEIIVSTDVESNGPIPGLYSMWSLGAAALWPDGTLVSRFSANLQDFPGAGSDPATMEFWARNPEAYERCRLDPEPPIQVMQNFAAWLGELPGNPVFLGSPVGFDFLFVRWYFICLLGHCPFGHTALDLRSYVMGVSGKDFSKCGKRDYPARLRVEAPHTHVCDEDGLEQGLLFSNWWREAKQLREAAALWRDGTERKAA
jgi:hypothetical protein